MKIVGSIWIGAFLWTFTIKSICRRSVGLVVMTLALHARGPQFKPGTEYFIATSGEMRVVFLAVCEKEKWRTWASIPVPLAC